MTRAVYIQNEDGDWDFVVAFNREKIPDFPSEWPAEICEWLAEDGEKPCIVEADLALLADILPAASPLIPGNPSPEERAEMRKAHQ